MTKTIIIPLVFMLHQTPTVETEPISIVLTSPVNGSVVSGTIPITAQVSSNVMKVDFYRDGKPIGTWYRFPTNPPPVNLKYLRASK